jgi:hypothetical protein
MKEAKVRKFANYLFPLTLHLLQEIERIITTLDNSTYSSRHTVSQEKRGRKTVNVHSTIPLTNEQMKNELDKMELIPVIQFVKDGLKAIGQPIMSKEEIITTLDQIHINTYHFEQIGNEEKITLQLISLIEAIKLSLTLGTQNLEKYNNVFAFLAVNTLKLLDQIGGFDAN